MGLDMNVREIPRHQKVMLQQFGQSILTYSAGGTGSYNVNSGETIPEYFDIEAYVLKNPTAQIPYSVGKGLCYWRKHPDIHGWMKNLFFEKGGQTESDFNGDNVFLTEEDVLQLKADIENENLPKTSGFFFGDSDGRLKENDLEKVDLMLDALSNGSLIYYTSSW